LQQSLQNLISKIKKAKKSKLPFVIYRSPNKIVVKAFVQKNSTLYYQSASEKAGFVFAPFKNSEKTVIFPLQKCEGFTASIEEGFISQLLENPVKIEKEERLGKQEYITLIKKAIQFLDIKKASKVVLSRKEKIALGDKNIYEIYVDLLYKYPSAFVYLWYHPKVGLWMGASPETLLKVKNNNFETMALAGTQVYKGSLNVVWENKEIQEQQFVTDYILSQLKDEMLVIGSPFTLKAGSLLHLCTKISGTLKHESQLETLVKILHPTPAVCGLPKKEAKIFILENENYNREYYTGYLGELRVNNQTNLFVNLRCMQIKNSKAHLYIGGGITNKSVPEKEWEETVVKSKIMKCVLT